MTDAADFSNRAEWADRVSEDGSVTLAWQVDGEIILEQADEPAFENPRVRYRGRDPAAVLTGLPEGTHYFRLGDAATGEWSEPLAVTVEFFPRGKLRLVVGLGAAVVVATIGTILCGHFRTQHEEEAG